jgi:hypothetical protein
MQTRLLKHLTDHKETLEELSLAQLIMELFRNEVSVGTDLTRKQCDGGIVNMKNTMCEPTEKINIKEKWSDVVAGRSKDRRNEDSTSNHLLESNITSRITEESWKTVSRGYKKPSSVNYALYYQILVIINRYELLRHEGRDKIEKQTNKHMENKHKVIVIGDSHA